MGQGQTVEGHQPSLAEQLGLSEEAYRSLLETLEVDDPQGSVELTAFVSCFPRHLRALVQPLFFSLSGQAVSGDPAVSWQAFLAGTAAVLCGRSNLSWLQLLQAWDSACTDPVVEDAMMLQHLLFVELAVSLCFWCAYPSLSPTESDEDLQPELGPLIRSLSAAVTAANVQDTMALAELLTRLAPMLPAAVGPRITSALLKTPAPPDILHVESRILEPGLLLLLRGISPPLWESGGWDPLFREWADGRSFSALLKGCLHYEGPALVLLKTAEGHILGALSTNWVEGNGKFAGSPESFLFTLTPSFQLMRCESAGGNISYLNSRNSYHPKGLGFGGQAGFYRLWIDADFEACSALKSDATYGAGSLLPNMGMQATFDPSQVEIWGVGGAEAKAQQTVLRAQAEGIREKARRVDRARMLETEFDKEMFFQQNFKATAGARETLQEERDTS